LGSKARGKTVFPLVFGQIKQIFLMLCLCTNKGIWCFKAILKKDAEERKRV